MSEFAASGRSALGVAPFEYAQRRQFVVGKRSSCALAQTVEDQSAHALRASVESSKSAD
jgi:hypothetical protein